MQESLPLFIVGSLNMDFIARVSRLPAPGETKQGTHFQMLPGGKGANQAYTVGKLGGRGTMIGCIGADVFGEALKKNLQTVGVNIDHLVTTSQASTGVALIEVEDSGQNQIVVIAGANALLSPQTVQAALLGAQSGSLLLQLESPLSTVEVAAAQAKQQGLQVILDPAPARSLPQTLLRNVDVLTPNESEALFLLGRDEKTITVDAAAEIARMLLSLGPSQVILKLGEKGAWWATADHHQYFPASQVQAVDTTAAGDCFNGALAVALAEGKTIATAIRFANTAAAISVTRPGAQAAIPSRDEVEAALALERL